MRINSTQTPNNIGDLVHLENYGPYAPFIAYGEECIVNINEDINSATWQTHYNSVMSILQDGIETKQVQNSFVTLRFNTGDEIELSLIDYWLTLIPWYLLVSTNTEIQPKHIFFVDEFRKGSISDYVNRFFIEPNRKKYTNRELNNIIDDMMSLYQGIDEFAFYLSNTINLEDSIDLMNACPEFRDILHADMVDIPMEDIKSIGMKYADRSIELIKQSRDYIGYDHCFADSFRAKESINPKQYKEAFINIGTKPDGRGGIFSKPIYTSFINGGLSEPVDYLIESSTGRTAQILQKVNVGNSGHFARLLGLNSSDSYLCKDPEYTCNTKRLIKITITSDQMLRKYNNRYYRTHPVIGLDTIINYREDKHLIGQTIYLRSPMTCASHARGEGICYKCYGDLAYTQNINIGRIASELLSAVLTQILLSAKHLIEAVVRKIEWCKHFFEFFDIDGNSIVFNSENRKDWKILIDPEMIQLESDIDFIDEADDEEGAAINSQFNEFLSEFTLQSPTGEEFVINSESGDSMYISSELNSAIRKVGEPLEGYIQIPVNGLEDLPLFFYHIQNDDLTKIFADIKFLLDNAAGVKGLDIDTWLQKVIDTIIGSNLSTAAIHLEVLMSNQIRSMDDPLFKPQWDYRDEPYKIVTLNTALTDNPSVVVSMAYQKLAKALYNPLTFRKRGPSFLDLFFMESPHIYVNSLPMDDDTIRDKDGLIVPIIFDTPIQDSDTIIDDLDLEE